MSNNSGSITPRSSTRDRKKVSRFQVETFTPKSSNFKKIMTHSVFNQHYVVYEVELKDGSKIKATDYDFKKSPEMLVEYKTNVTQQTANSDGEYVVERVLTHRMVHGKPLFLVKWEGYAHPVWNSEMWEDELVNWKSILNAYKSKSMLTSSKPAPTRKRNHSSSDEEEEEDIELTPKKTAKKANLIEKKDEDEGEDEPAETVPSVRRAAEMQEEDEYEEDGIEEERVLSDDGGQKKGWFSGFNFGNWF